MMQIFKMQTTETVNGAIDTDIVNSLRNAVGDRRYQEIAEDAVFLLAERLGHLDKAMGAGDFANCYRHAVSIAGIASQIGMLRVGQIAQHVMECAKAEDMVALHAVIGRLNRVTELSLSSVFDDGV